MNRFDYFIRRGCPNTFDNIVYLQYNPSSFACTELFTFTFMHFADAFIQSDLQDIQVIIFFVIMCVPWELNPQPFALLTQCSTTEPQQHVP